MNVTFTVIGNYSANAGYNGQSNTKKATLILMSHFVFGSRAQKTAWKFSFDFICNDRHKCDSGGRRETILI